MGGVHPAHPRHTFTHFDRSEETVLNCSPASHRRRLVAARTHLAHTCEGIHTANDPLFVFKQMVSRDAEYVGPSHGGGIAPLHIIFVRAGWLARIEVRVKEKKKKKIATHSARARGAALSTFLVALSVVRRPSSVVRRPSPRRPSSLVAAALGAPQFGRMSRRHAVRDSVRPTPRPPPARPSRAPSAARRSTSPPPPPPRRSTARATCCRRGGTSSTRPR